MAKRLDAENVCDTPASLCNGPDALLLKMDWRVLRLPKWLSDQSVMTRAPLMPVCLHPLASRRLRQATSPGEPMTFSLRLVSKT